MTLSALSLPAAAQTFQLEKGDYRWIPLSVRRTPTAIDVRFTASDPNTRVHAELMPMRDFILFSHHNPYTPMAQSDSGATGRFRRVVTRPGNYRLVLLNDDDSASASVSLVIRTQTDPAPMEVSAGLTTRRKVGVIIASLMLFAAMAVWPAKKLLQAYRARNEGRDASATL